MVRARPSEGRADAAWVSHPVPRALASLPAWEPAKTAACPAPPRAQLALGAPPSVTRAPPPGLQAPPLEPGLRGHSRPAPTLWLLLPRDGAPVSGSLGWGRPGPALASPSALPLPESCVPVGGEAAHMTCHLLTYPRGQGGL